jgi:hypothetical protein
VFCRELGRWGMNTRVVHARCWSNCKLCGWGVSTHNRLTPHVTPANRCIRGSAVTTHYPLLAIGSWPMAHGSNGTPHARDLGIQGRIPTRSATRCGLRRARSCNIAVSCIYSAMGASLVQRTVRTELTVPRSVITGYGGRCHITTED